MGRVETFPSNIRSDSDHYYSIDKKNKIDIKRALKLVCGMRLVCEMGLVWNPIELRSHSLFWEV